MEVLKKYKNILMFLGVFLGIIFLLYKVYNFYELRLESFEQEIRNLGEKTELAKNISSYEAKLLGAKEKFLPLDSYAFIRLINEKLSQLNLKVVSIRPREVFLPQEKRIVIPLTLTLNLRGSFEDLLSFLKRIDEEETLITISELEIKGEGALDIKLNIVGLALEGLGL